MKTHSSFVIALLLGSSINIAHGLAFGGKAQRTSKGADDRSTTCNRRTLLTSALTTVVSAATVFGLPDESKAFDNKISAKYDDRPKRRGPQPQDLGVSKRKDMDGEMYQGLKQCGAAPNCFSSTDRDDPDHLIPAWKWPSGVTKKEAFEQLATTVKAYVPGQKDIDGGGFKVMTVDTDKGYIYVQFEALKNGYIDDFELVCIDGIDGGDSVQVRSSSRVGYLDFGVNAKRINFIAKALRAQGWNAEGVDPATHEFYVMENSR